MSKNIFVACDISDQKEVINLLEKIHHDILMFYVIFIKYYNKSF